MSKKFLNIFTDMTMDVRDMSALGASTFDAVIDKGTLPCFFVLPFYYISIYANC